MSDLLILLISGILPDKVYKICMLAANAYSYPCLTYFHRLYIWWTLWKLVWVPHVEGYEALETFHDVAEVQWDGIFWRFCDITIKTQKWIVFKIFWFFQKTYKVKNGIWLRIKDFVYKSWDKTLKWISSNNEACRYIQGS